MLESRDSQENIEPARKKKDASFTGDVIKIASGTTLAQALSILITPIITRIYGPEAFGLYALFIAITSIVGVVACLRYELAIMLPKKEEEAANLLAASLVFSVLISILMFPLIYFVGKPFTILINSVKLEPYLWFAPFSILLSGFFLAFNYWNSRTKHFGRLSIARVASSLSQNGSQLASGLAGHVTGGSLVLGYIIGIAVSSLTLGAQIWKDNGSLMVKSISCKNILLGLKRYKNFPIFDTWSALLGTASAQLPTFLLSAFFSPVVVGYYALGMMALQLPASLIGGAVSQVFFQRAAEAKREGKLAGVVESTVLHLGMLGVYPFLLLSLIGKEVFTVVFGQSWAEAGIYAQILSLMILITFISSPISTLFSVLEKQGPSLIFNIIFVPVRIAALVAGGLVGSARISVILFASMGIISYTMVFVWLLHKTGVRPSSLLARSKKYMIYSLILLAPSALAKWIIHMDPVIILIVGAITSSIYYMAIMKDLGLTSLGRHFLR
jgi:lipopolysaccharide exporter